MTINFSSLSAEGAVILNAVAQFYSESFHMERQKAK